MQDRAGGTDIVPDDKFSVVVTAGCDGRTRPSRLCFRRSLDHAQNRTQASRTRRRALSDSRSGAESGGRGVGAAVLVEVGGGLAARGRGRGRGARRGAGARAGGPRARRPTRAPRAPGRWRTRKAAPATWRTPLRAAPMAPRTARPRHSATIQRAQHTGRLLQHRAGRDGTGGEGGGGGTVTHSLRVTSHTPVDWGRR